MIISTHDISAFILAGGKSSRMGTDKGLLSINGKPMVKSVIDCLQNYFTEIKIISNNEDYHQFKLSVIADEIKDAGPIGGLYTGLRITTTDWNLFIACDMPFMSHDIIGKLVSNIQNTQAVVPVYLEQKQPLCALFHRSVLSEIKIRIDSEKFKMHELIAALNTTYVTIQPSSAMGQNPFSNINTIEELNNINIK